MPARRILHIDLDAFFASIEQRDHPEYRRRPVVVGAEPGRRGVVAACSYEARRYGVHSAMPISEAVRRLPPETVYLRPRIDYYACVSREALAALGTISPLVESASIDEAYLDISGLDSLFGPPEAIGRRAKAVIREAVGLRASVGIGPNRLVAKLASDYRKPDGLTVVPRERVQAFLDPLPLTALRGVGPKTAPRLRQMGLRTIADVRQVPLLELRRRFGHLAGTRIYAQCRGQADDTVEPGRRRQSISKEITFDSDLCEVETLRETLYWAAQEVGALARRAGRRGVSLTLKLRLADFTTHTLTRSLSVPTAEDRTLFREAWGLYRQSPWSGKPLRLIGLSLSGWDPSDAPSAQRELFPEAGPEEDSKTAKLYRALDAVREKFGKDALHFGVLPAARSQSPKRSS